MKGESVWGLYEVNNTSGFDFFRADTLFAGDVTGGARGGDTDALLAGDLVA